MIHVPEDFAEFSGYRHRLVDDVGRLLDLIDE